MEILCFGIARDLTGTDRLDWKAGKTVSQLRKELAKKYHKLGELGVYMVAVNEEYAQDDVMIEEDDTVAIIPPVSGG